MTEEYWALYLLQHLFEQHLNGINRMQKINPLYVMPRSGNKDKATLSDL